MFPKSLFPILMIFIILHGTGLNSPLKVFLNFKAMLFVIIVCFIVLPISRFYFLYLQM